MNWSEVGRFFVGSWLWDRFVNEEVEELQEKKTVFSYVLLTIRIAVIGVIAFMAFSFFKKTKKKR
jgi:hypothetical protein